MARRGGKIKQGEYDVYDFFDDSYANPRRFSFAADFAEGDEFEHDSVTYRVIDTFARDGGIAVVLRAIKQRLTSTNTQIVHKCPARKRQTDKLSRNDVVRLEARYGKKRASIMASPRVRLGITLVSVCPDCGCEFWKLDASRPEPVYIDKVMGDSDGSRSRHPRR